MLGPALREAGDVEWATEKWGGHPHYRSAAHVLGEDEHGTWLWGPAGRTIHRGDQALFVAEQERWSCSFPIAGGHLRGGWAIPSSTCT